MRLPILGTLEVSFPGRFGEEVHFYERVGRPSRRETLSEFWWMNLMQQMLRGQLFISPISGAVRYVFLVRPCPDTKSLTDDGSSHLDIG
jgi:hypothetical protein